MTYVLNLYKEIPEEFKIVIPVKITKNEFKSMYS